MAKEISLADIEPAIEIFRQANIQAVQKVLDRAEKKARAAGKGQHRGLKTMMRKGKGAKLLSRTLGKAMDFHGRQAKGRPSIRLTAPDAGGRPYHFGYTVVTKGQRKQTASSARRAGTEGGAAAGGREGVAPGRKAAGTGKRHRASTREGAHQLYTERDNAVEEGLPLDGRPLGPQAMSFKDGSLEPDGPAVAGDARDAGAAREGADREAGEARQGGKEDGREAGQAWAEEGMSRSLGLSERHGEAAAQAYIEDESKVPKLRGSTASFGTIGDTIEERLRFWELVHEHESDKGGRTQSRLVLELPHEASPKERHEIVRRYTDDMFRAKGIPYWASIHAPTKENDDRNHHAHVVFTERPAAIMTDPDTGLQEWDFALAVRKKTECRHVIDTYPYRQKRSDDMRDRGWVKRARARFAEVTNDVMVEAGKGVRYDPRSYKDMGLDAAPMRNVKRIVTDKAKGQTFVVMDAEWTRRMIDLEMRDAAIRRSGTFQAMVRNEALLEQSGRSAAASEKAQARLPAHLRMGVGGRVGTALGRRIMTAVLEGERERLARRFVEEATERTLRNVMEATRPQPKAKAAREEMAAHKRGSASATAAAARRMRTLRDLWGGDRPRTPPPDDRMDGPPLGQPRRAGPVASETPREDDVRPQRAKARDEAGADDGRKAPAAPAIVTQAERQQREGQQRRAQAASNPLAAPNLSPRLTPDLGGGRVMAMISARMAAMVAQLDVAALMRGASFEERLRQAGEGDKHAAEKLAEMDRRAATLPALVGKTPKPAAAVEPPAGGEARTRGGANRPAGVASEDAIAAGAQNRPAAPAPNVTAKAPSAAPAKAREVRELTPNGSVAAPRPGPAPARKGRVCESSYSAKREMPSSQQANAGRTEKVQADVLARPPVEATQTPLTPAAAKTEEAEPAADPIDAAEAEKAARKKARRKAIISRRGRGGPER